MPLASILDLARTMRESPGVRLARRGAPRAAAARRGRHARRAADARARHRRRDRRPPSTSRRCSPSRTSSGRTRSASRSSASSPGSCATGPCCSSAPTGSTSCPVDSIHREWRARLLSQRLAEEARLAPLTYEQTALVTTLILATGLPAPREVVSAVYERTDGIPLHIEELLGALGDDARADGRAIRNADVPDTIEDAILARVSRMSEDAQAVARAGAVIGRCFVPDVLAGVMDRQVADLEAALEELVANSVLFPFQFVDEGYFDFRHQLLRDALYESVPAPALRTFHARAAEFGAQPRRQHRDPCVGPLRAGRPAGRGVPRGARGRRGRERDVQPQRGVRAVRAGRRERPRRPPARGAGGRSTTRTARPRSPSTTSRSIEAAARRARALLPRGGHARGGRERR